MKSNKIRVYKHIDSKNMSYITYTSQDIKSHWSEVYNRTSNSDLKVALNITPYNDWVHEVLFESEIKSEAFNYYINNKFLGDYNKKNTTDPLNKPGIYVITNNITGEQYVGKTKKSISGRWWDHVNKSKKNPNTTKFTHAISKYGKDNFSVDILDETPTNEKEIYWIDKLNSVYNMTPGGDGGWINDKTGKTWKVKDTTNMKLANKKSANKRKVSMIPKISNGNNYQCNYRIKTPWGIFDTWKNAQLSAKFNKLNGIGPTVTDTFTIQKYCKSNILLPFDGRIQKSWQGKYTYDIGFGFELLGSKNEK